MIPLVKMCFALTGSCLPETGLVFHASFRDEVLAESGQNLEISEGDVRIVQDDELGRNVLHSERGVLKFPQAGLPTGNAPFTIALWAKFDSLDDNSMIVGWGSTPWGETVAAIRYVDGGIRLSPWGSTYTEPAADPDCGKWHHWCGVYDGGGRAQLYLDGRPVAEGKFGFEIGEEQGSLGTFWAWENAEFRAANVRIYDRALTGSEIMALAEEK